jgi:hypothetical protein
VTDRRLARIALASLFATSLAAGGLYADVARAAPPLQADVEYGSFTCGTHVQGVPIVGTAGFKRGGDRLKLSFSLQSSPEVNTDYDVYLFDGDTCTEIGGVLGSFTTDASGAGSLHVKKIDVSGHDTFFARAVDTSSIFAGITHTSLKVDLP